MFVLILIGDRGVQQHFGPYETQELAEQAAADLESWPVIDGEWDVKPLTAHGPVATKPAPIVLPAPYQPPAWPYPSVAPVWCSVEPAGMTTATAPATYTFTGTVLGDSDLIASMRRNLADYDRAMGRDDEDPPAGVPARI